MAKTPHFLVQFLVGNQIPHATTKFASHRTKDGVKILRATIQIGRSQINKNKIIKEIKTEKLHQKKKRKAPSEPSFSEQKGLLAQDTADAGLFTMRWVASGGLCL